jgi:modulator of FtsH protease HflC
MRKAGMLALIAAAVALVCAYDLFFLVSPSGQAVVTQLGQPVAEALEPGLHVKAPFVQQAVLFDKRVLSWKSGVMEISTRDNMPVALEVTARWRITSPMRFVRTLGTYEKAYTRLDDAIPSALKAHVLKTGLRDIVRSNAPLLDAGTVQGGAAAAPVPGEDAAVAQGRDALMRAVRADASRGLESLGIVIVDVKVKRLAYQQRFLNLVHERMITERQARAEALRSEGEGRRAEIAGLMEKELQGLRSEAFRTAEEIRGRADAEAARIYGEAYNQDPEFYAFLKTLETYRNTPLDNTTLILGTDTEFYRFLKGSSKQ